MVELVGWPIVELDASEATPEAAPSVVFDTLMAAVERQEMFAAVVRMPEVPPRGRRVAGAVERVRMLKRLRPGLVEHCRGLAFVMSEEGQRNNAKALRSGPTMWGCPTFATDDPRQARSWAQARLDDPEGE
jgi:hypothetical protein